MRSFPDRYIDSVKNPGWATAAMPFGIALPAVLISRFKSFAAISPTSPALGRLKRLVAKVWVTECEIRDALKQVGLNKSPGLDGLPLRSVL